VKDRGERKACSFQVCRKKYGNPEKSEPCHRTGTARAFAPVKKKRRRIREEGMSGSSHLISKEVGPKEAIIGGGKKRA